MNYTSTIFGVPSKDCHDVHEIVALCGWCEWSFDLWQLNLISGMRTAIVCNGDLLEYWARECITTNLSCDTRVLRQLMIVPVDSRAFNLWSGCKFQPSLRIHCISRWMTTTWRTNRVATTHQFTTHTRRSDAWVFHQINLNKLRASGRFAHCWTIWHSRPYSLSDRETVAATD